MSAVRGYFHHLRAKNFIVSEVGDVFAIEMQRTSRLLTGHPYYSNAIDCSCQYCET
jgi:hypothetical protein